MLAEKIIFNIIATYLLIAMLFKLIKRADKLHICIIIAEVLGLVLGFIEIICKLNFNIYIKALIYLISIINPIIIIVLEHKGKNILELFLMVLAKICELTR